MFGTFRDNPDVGQLVVSDYELIQKYEKTYFAMILKIMKFQEVKKDTILFS